MQASSYADFLLEIALIISSLRGPHKIFIEIYSRYSEFGFFLVQTSKCDVAVASPPSSQSLFESESTRALGAGSDTALSS